MADSTMTRCPKCKGETHRLIGTDGVMVEECLRTIDCGCDYKVPLMPALWESYKGFELEAKPGRLKDGGWSTAVYIWKGPRVRPYYGSNVWPTLEDGIQQSFDLSRVQQVVILICHRIPRYC